MLFYADCFDTKNQTIPGDITHKIIAELWDVLSELHRRLCIPSDMDYNAIWGGGGENDHSINLLLDKSNFQGC
jgi:hypothetical protein